MATPSILVELFNWASIFGLIGGLFVFFLIIIGLFIFFMWIILKKKMYDIVDLKQQRMYLSAEMSCRAGIKGQYLYIGGQGLKYVIQGFEVLDWLDPVNAKSKPKQIVITVKKNSVLPYSLPMKTNKMMIRCDTDDIEGDVNTITGDITLKAVDLKKRDFYFVPIKRWDDAPKPFMPQGYAPNMPMPQARMPVATQPQPQPKAPMTAEDVAKQLMDRARRGPGDPSLPGGG